MQEPDIYVRIFKYVGTWDIWAQFISGISCTRIFMT